MSVAAAVHPAVRRIWEARLGADAADRFLRADLADAPEPASLPGLPRAADRIEAALESGERIAVFGHDDPDGITSCAILVETLEARGAAPVPYVPDRNVEGHGLYPDLVRRFAADGMGLLVTTDGCSANVAEAELARSLGMDVVVTDHHVIAEGRPAVPRLVNPMADPETAQRLGDLTGAGVAALLANELIARAGGGAAERERLLDLVALGTIADYGDCSRSNRAMIVHGLRACARGDRPAVAEVARRLGVSDPFAGGSARRLAGVFAAVPSVAGASKGLAALLGRPGADAALDELLEAVDRADEERARAIRAGEKAARAAGVYDGAPAVLTLEGVRSPFLGAVAQSLVEETGRPAAVLRDADGQVVAELRGPESVHLVDVLASMSELLDTWGGHRRAAGFSARAARAADVLQRLHRALDVPPDDGADSEEPEADLTAADVDGAFLASLAAARPFGKGNPEPRLRVDGDVVPAERLLESHGGPRPGAHGAESAP